MNSIVAQSLNAYLKAIAEVPVIVADWTTSMDDDTFLRVMVVGAVILTFVIARALR